jgi:hypothetical protein
MENYDQAGAGTPVNSTIDGLPIGALHWHDQTVPPSSYTSLLLAYQADVIASAITSAPVIAGDFRLSQNYPNPFNPSTQIDFTLPAEFSVDLKVFNILGQEVAAVAHGLFTPGRHTVTFNAAALASGVYIYRITAGGYTSTKDMLLLK